MKNPNNDSRRSRNHPARDQRQVAAASQNDAPVEISNDDIARRAYSRWEQSDGSHGRDQEHWYAAEQELRQGRGTRGSGDGQSPAPDEL